MSDKQVDGEQVAKALASLSDIAKGFAAGSAPFKEVETKKEVGGATQVFHTPSNSDPKSWAGTTEQSVVEGDAIDGNGTDYNGRVVKSILDQVVKGQLSAEAAAIVIKGLPFMKKDDDKDDDKDDKKDDDKKDKKFGKGSLADDIDEDKKVEKSIVADPELQKGFEVSDFLKSFGVSVERSIAGLKSDLVKHIDSRLAQTSGKQEGFNKSLTEALVSFGEAITVQEARVEQVERQPARAPKAVGYINKSFGGEEKASELTKSDMLKSLTDMCEQGKIAPHAVLKFEASGEISSDLVSRVHAFRAGK